MGCGGSAQKKETADEKYKKPQKEDEKGAKDKGAADEGKTKSHKGHSHPQVLEASPVASPGTPSKNPPHKVTVVHGKHRLECKFGDTELKHRQQLWQIIRGQDTIQRGPPTSREARCAVQIRTDFGKEVNLVLGGEEAERMRAAAAAAAAEKKKDKKEKKEKSAEASECGIDARGLLLSRTAAARKLQGLRVETLRGHPKQVQVAQISPNDWLLVTSGCSLIGKDVAARCTDITVGLQVGVLDGARKDVLDPIHGAAFTTDGQQLATVHHTEQLLIWDMNTFRVKKLISVDVDGMECRLISVATSPDMKLVACAADTVNEDEELMGIVPIYETSGQLVIMFKEHQASVTAVDFSPDSETIATGSKDGAVLLWKPRTGEVIRNFEGHSTDIRRVTFSPDGQTLYTLDEHFLSAWNVADGTIKWSRHIDGAISVGKTPAEVSEQQAEGAGKNPTKMRFTTVCLAASGIGFLGMTDRLVTVFDVHTGEHVDSVTTKAPVTAMSAGCRCCALGDMWGNLYLVHIL